MFIMHKNNHQTNDLAKSILLEYFATDISIAFLSKNIEKIKNLLHRTDFTQVKKNQVEKYVFLEAIKWHNHVIGQEILNYLIFDYQVCEKNSLDLMLQKDIEIENMFALRRLKNNLNNELPNKKDFNNSKKDKI